MIFFRIKKQLIPIWDIKFVKMIVRTVVVYFFKVSQYRKYKQTNNRMILLTKN